MEVPCFVAIRTNKMNQKLLAQIRPVESSSRPNSRIRKLFCVGDWSALDTGQCLTMVASRNLSPYGQHMLEAWLPSLVRAGVVPVALVGPGAGDLIHPLAVKLGGRSAGVVSWGLAAVTSSANDAQMEGIIAADGWLVSSVEPLQVSSAWTFLAANRLLASLGSSLLVPEARRHSGCLSVVQEANNLGKPVFALPGRVNDPLSWETNRLIRDGQAILVDDPGQILAALNLNVTDIKVDSKVIDKSSKQKLLNYLKEHPMGLNELSMCSQLDLTKLGVAMTELTLAGIVTEDEEGRYRLVENSQDRAAD